MACRCLLDLDLRHSTTRIWWFGCPVGPQQVTTSSWHTTNLRDTFFLKSSLHETLQNYPTTPHFEGQVRPRKTKKRKQEIGTNPTTRDSENMMWPAHLRGSNMLHGQKPERFRLFTGGGGVCAGEGGLPGAVSLPQPQPDARAPVPRVAQLLPDAPLQIHIPILRSTGYTMPCSTVHEMLIALELYSQHRQRWRVRPIKMNRISPVLDGEMTHGAGGVAFCTTVTKKNKKIIHLIFKPNEGRDLFRAHWVSSNGIILCAFSTTTTEDHQKFIFQILFPEDISFTFAQLVQGL